jgi:hypothetical protein
MSCSLTRALRGAHASAACERDDDLIVLLSGLNGIGAACRIGEQPRLDPRRSLLGLPGGTKSNIIPAR